MPTNYQSRLVDDWNDHHPIGTKVEVTLDDGTTLLTSTRTSAKLLDGHTAVIWLEDLTGRYMLERVRPFSKHQE